MRIKYVAAGLLPLLFLGGCGAKMTTITSSPSGALVTVNGDPVGMTPLKHAFDYSQRTYYAVDVRKPGYLDAQLQLIADTDTAQRDAITFDLPEDPAWKETTPSDATNQWLRIPVSERVTREMMWQTLVDSVTSRYSNIEQFDAASGYIRSVPLTKIYRYPNRAGEYYVRTQFLGSIVSAQPLVYKIKIQSERSEHPGQWLPFDRIFSGDQQLVEELQNRLGLK